MLPSVWDKQATTCIGTGSRDGTHSWALRQCFSRRISIALCRLAKETAMGQMGYCDIAKRNASLGTRQLAQWITTLVRAEDLTTYYGEHDFCARSRIRHFV